MAIKIEFDGPQNPRVPTIVLAARNGEKLGVLNAVDNIVVKDSITDACELSFDVHKYVDGRLCALWNDIKDFKLVWCKEWDRWFSIQVKITEANDTIKNVIGTDLGVFELSQIMLYDVEINTEDDINRDDYDEEYPTILYDPDHPDSSLLHRILSKAPHYTIAHVDENIANIQRTFTFDNKSIMDAFEEVKEEIGCLFSYGSYSGNGTEIIRAVSVYDASQTCIDCNFRGDFTETCPECGGSNILNGYGEDTTIFVSTDCLTDEITYETEVESIKNTYRLIAGDDVMTGVVRNCNITPGGYMYYFPPDLRDDMSPELKNKLDEYDEQYKEYESSATIDEQESVTEYNTLVQKYSSFNEDLVQLPSPLEGFHNIVKAYYEAVDFGAYLQSGLMPTPQIDEQAAEDQVELLTAAALSPIAISTLSNQTTTSNVENAIRIMAGVLVNTAQFRITVNTLDWTRPTWQGTIRVASYADEDDIATTQTLTLTITDDSETYTRQVLERKLATLDDKEYGLVGLFKLTLSEFNLEIKKYCLDSLSYFLTSCQDVLNILTEQGANVSTSTLYNSLYVPYSNKKSSLEQEIDVRHNEVVALIGDVSVDNEGEETVTTNGLMQYTTNARREIENEMKLETYLGNELWLELCTYRREDEYSNSNFTSDGLNNSELVDKALEFLKRAKEEIVKASTNQHTISATLNNLLVIEEFKPLIDHFSVGNWIRVRVDDCIYRLRLTDYEIDYSDLSTISVTFCDATKTRSLLSDVSKALSNAVLSSDSINAMSRLADKGGQASTILDAWIKDGLLAGEQLQLYNKDGSPIFNQNGQLIVSRGIDQSDLTDLMQEVAPEDGEDAVTLRIDSSRGLVFKNNMFSTQLRVTVLYGVTEITNISALRSHFGSGAYLQWSYRRFEDENWSVMLANDNHISNNGFELTVSPADVNEQIVFQCDLIS